MTDWERTVRLPITADFWAAGFLKPMFMDHDWHTPCVT